MGRLVINGEEVYELDEACLCKKKKQEEVKRSTKKLKNDSIEKIHKK